jgi:hypothetical protein
MIGHEVTFLDARFFLLRQRAKHIAEMPPQLSVEHFASALRYENNVILHSHFEWLRLSYSIRDPLRVL